VYGAALATSGLRVAVTVISFNGSAATAPGTASAPGLGTATPGFGTATGSTTGSAARITTADTKNTGSIRKTTACFDMPLVLLSTHGTRKFPE
jgi:hypothetical protein